MSDKKLNAINFANDFFTLINCSTSELENYLAKDVVVDWFGETISGRCNVAEFLMYQRKNSRHIFKEILPTDTIGYRKSPLLRRKYTSVGGGLNEINDTIDDSNIPYKRKCYSDVHLQVNKNNNNQWNDSIDIVEEESDLDHQEKMEVTESYISNELDFEKLAIDNFSTPLRVPNTNTADNNGYVLHNVALNSKIASKIKQTNMNDIEKFIDQLTIKNNTLYDHNVISIANNNNNQSIKYIETYGAIEISRYFHTEQVRKDIRRRHCKLQIAYSVNDNNISDDNNHLVTPKHHCVDSKHDLYEKDNAKVVANSDIDFNYIIHLLIYSPNTKCRLNLSNEFEGKEFLE